MELLSRVYLSRATDDDSRPGIGEGETLLPQTVPVALPTLVYWYRGALNRSNGREIISYDKLLRGSRRGGYVGVPPRRNTHRFGIQSDW